MALRFRRVVQIFFSSGNDALAGAGGGAGVVGAGGGGGAAEDLGLGLGWRVGAWWWGWRRRSAVLVLIVIVVVIIMFGYKALCCICLCGIVCSVENVDCAVEEIVVQEIGGCIAEAFFSGIKEIIRLAVQTEDLDSSRYCFIAEFLLAPPIKLFLIAAGWVGVVYTLGYRDRDVHVIQAVCFNGLVVEPRTVTGFPLEAADHAEFSTAATSHVVTAFFQFDGGLAVVTALPAFLFGDPDEFLGRCVLGTFARGVPSVVAEAADFGSTSLAFAVLPAMVRTTTSVSVDICRLDPLAAFSSRAVDTILCCVFLIFLVP